MQLPEGIYFESTPAFNESTGQQHAYLVFRDGKGDERVIRGGPNVPLPPFGRIAIQADIPLRDSKDAYEKGETPSTRQAKRLVLGDREPRTVWNEMVKRAKEIGNARINYDLLNIDVDRTDGERTILTKEHRGQNSNSVIRAVLENSKLDVKKIISEDEFFNRFHGIENDLSNPAGGLNPKRPPERKSSIRPTEKLRVDTIFGPESAAPVSDLNANATIPDQPTKTEFSKSSITPAAKEIERTALGGEETLEEILAKPPNSLSETEVNRLTREKGTLLSNDPRREQVENSLTAAHEKAFQNGRVSNQPFPLDITPASTPNGLPVSDGIKQVIGTFFEAADDSGIPGGVSTLQTTLNRVERDALPLKVDGIFGDKTRDRLRATIAQKGPEPILSEFGDDNDGFDVYDDEDLAFA